MKLVIVTGGSKGLGAALIDQYEREGGWHILELSRSGRPPYNVKCDLSDTDAVESLSAELFADLAVKDWEELVYINNGGDLQPISMVKNLTSRDIVQHITVNQSSAFILLAGFIAAFRNFSGRKSIVNISSGAADQGVAGWSLYCASKAASENFIGAIAVEEAHQPLPFIAINYQPGIMDTFMQTSIRGCDIEDFPEVARFIDFKDSGALRAPKDVANDLKQKVNQGMISGKRYGIE